MYSDHDKKASSETVTDFLTNVNSNCDSRDRDFSIIEQREEEFWFNTIPTMAKNIVDGIKKDIQTRAKIGEYETQGDKKIIKNIFSFNMSHISHYLGYNETDFLKKLKHDKHSLNYMGTDLPWKISENDTISPSRHGGYEIKCPDIINYDVIKRKSKWFITHRYLTLELTKFGSSFFSELTKIAKEYYIDIQYYIDSPFDFHPNTFHKYCECYNRVLLDLKSDKYIFKIKKFEYLEDYYRISLSNPANRDYGIGYSIEF